MKKFKAVIFDMDGTIVDTSAVWKNVNTLFLIKWNIFSQELLHRLNHLLHGIPPKVKLKELKEICGLQSIDDEVIIADFDTLSKESYKEEISYIKECEGFIDSLTSLSIPVAIATNSSNLGIEKVSSIINLKRHFKEHIYGIESVNNKAKPHPDIFLHAANQLGIMPIDCIVFEDSIHGIEAAKKANMFTIAINTSQLPRHLISADKIIDCYSEIILSDYFLM
jgi:HAD superfamily hydrolase (TIGR01509 family)